MGRVMYIESKRRTRNSPSYHPMEAQVVLDPYPLVEIGHMVDIVEVEV